MGHGILDVQGERSVHNDAENLCMEDRAKQDAGKELYERIKVELD